MAHDDSDGHKHEPRQGHSHAAGPATRMVIPTAPASRTSTGC